MTLDERNRMLKNWRGRRLLACQAADLLHEVAGALAEDDGSQPPPPGAQLPTTTESQRRELQNAVALVLRMTLLMNDGSVSHQELRRY